ncbi:MAG: preQ(1) synthase, partial [Candidatus Omnitrophica bacterium]|nr:preQ(1) synthase [Candidatus Omnitrophota bacterium]
YVPDQVCIELKSLKYYFLSFRQVKIFHEHVVNRIMEDLVGILKPHQLEVAGDFNIRGGISTKAAAKYHRESKGQNCF